MKQAVGRTAWRPGGWILLAFAMFAVSAGASVLRAQTLAPRGVGVSGYGGGSVYSAAVTEQHLYIAGLFDFAGPVCGSWLALDLETGQVIPGGALVAGYVAVSTPDGAGGWFLGGTITGVNGVPRQGLAHILADGSLSTWAPSVNGGVTSLAKVGSALFVGGSFTSINGVGHPYLAAVDATSGDLLTWGSGASNTVEALSVVGDTLFVGGWFRQIHGVSRSSLAALSVATGEVLPWAVTFTGSPFAQGTPNVTCIEQDGGRLYIGGDFNTIEGVATGSFAAIERATAMLVPGSYPVGWGTTDILVHGGRIYVSGPFSASSSAGDAYGLVALSRSTLQLVPWAPERPRQGRLGSAIAAYGNRVFIGEGWTDPQSPIEPLRAVDTTTGAVLPFGEELRSAGGAVALQVAGGRLFVGGLLESFGAVPRRSLAEIDLRNGQLTERTMELPDGEYSQYVATDGQRVFAWTYGYGLFAFDPAIGPTPLWVKPMPQLNAMLGVQGRLFVLGTIPLPGGGTRYGAGEIDPGTGDLLPWSPVFAYPGSYVNMGALSSDASRLYVGGRFTTVDGAAHEGLVAFRLSDMALEPVEFDATTDVLAIAASDNRVFAICSRVGWPQPSLFAFDRLTGAALPWTPLGGVDWQMNPYSWTALTVSNGELVVANPLQVNSGPLLGRHPLFRTSLTASSWSPYPYEPGARQYDHVLGLTGRDGVLAVVGRFNSMGPYPAAAVALLTWPSVGVPPVGTPAAEPLTLWPDPARERLTLRLAPAVGAVRRVDIFDVTGRLVRSLAGLPEAGGEVNWDLCRADGTHVAPGVHFAVERVGVERRSVARFIVVR